MPDSINSKRPINRPSPTNIKRRPKVSIIIPCLSEEERIADTLYSLFKQSIFKDSEVILCEFNPYDDPYLRDLSHGMAHVKHMTVNRAGIAFARHMGIMSANAPIICNYDADCEFIDKYCLENMIRPIQNRECVISVNDNVFDLTELPVNELPRMDLPTKTLNFLNNLQRTTPIACLEPGSCLDKKAYEFVGGFSDTKMWELFDLNNRLLYHFSNIQSLLFSMKSGPGTHKKHIDDSAVIVSSRRAIKWSEYGIQVLDYANAYR